MARFRDRSTGDILVIIIAFTICFAVVATGTWTAIYLFLNPGANVDAPVRLIADVMNTLIGLLAGFLAGSTTVNSVKKEPDAPPPDV